MTGWYVLDAACSLILGLTWGWFYWRWFLRKMRYHAEGES